MPQRSLLHQKRNVDESGLWAFGWSSSLSSATSGPGHQISATHWQLADEAFAGLGRRAGHRPEAVSLTPEDLGVRITYLASQPPTETSAPDCDFAVPFA